MLYSHLLKERNTNKVECILHDLKHHLAERYTGFDELRGIGLEDLVVVIPVGELLGKVIQEGAHDAWIVLRAGFAHDFREGREHLEHFAFVLKGKHRRVERHIMIGSLVVLPEH